MRFRRELSKCSEAVRLTLSRPVRALGMVHDLRTLRRRVARIRPPLSQTELGELLAPYRVNGHADVAYTRSYICELENGAKPFTADVLSTIERFVADQVRLATNGRVMVRACLGVRVWRFEAIAICARCGKPFVMRRSSDVRCSRCRAQ